MAGHIAIPCAAGRCSYAALKAKFGDLERWPSSAKNRHEKNLGRVAWRASSAAKEDRRDPTYFLALRSDPMALSGGLPAESKFLAFSL